MTTDARQRAREAASRCFPDDCMLHMSSEEQILRAIEVYFDERMRGEATPDDCAECAALQGDLCSVHIHAEYDRRDVKRLRARVAELEAVVRTADAMHVEMHALVRTGGSWSRSETALAAFESARAKVQVPGE